MEPTFASSLDALADWRRALDRRVADLSRFLADQALLDAAAAEAIDVARQRLAADRLVVAFVAEFSRGKSELINAIFFADTGRRILPATPGRTTMCPVELAWDPAQPPSLSLLPIETRLEGFTLAELRERGSAWTLRRLDPQAPQQLVEALLEVMRTKAVGQAEARALGFWDDAQPQDNPPLNADGLVEVPAWRHARINYPHPLLQRGLVVLDTPGLNAIGAEPELTLSLLPAAHAAVFVLAADSGVTKSDLAVWREHLASQSVARYVVLNKIDTLADPLAAPHEVQAQIDQQCRVTAATLGLAREHVFPLSARQALAARIDGDRAALAASRLPALEAALGERLLPQRREMLREAVLEAVSAVQTHALRALADRRRQVVEQSLELRGLRGKSDTRVQLMLARIDRETQEFERCTTRLTALRAVQARMLREALEPLAGERLREEVARMQAEINGSLWHLGARKAFLALCARLRGQLEQARRLNEEIQQMLAGSFRLLNSEFGFALMLPRQLGLARPLKELDLIERNYGQYLGPARALRLVEGRFVEQFRRMLVSKLRVVFETAGAEIEMWNKSASSQVDSQLRERRRGFKRRREALERIQGAAGELEARLAQLEDQDARAAALEARLHELLSAVREEAGGLAPDSDTTALKGASPPLATSSPVDAAVDMVKAPAPAAIAAPAPRAGAPVSLVVGAE